MSNMLLKKFYNVDLGVEIDSFIDKKLMVWFKAKDVAQILGYKNTEKAIKRHVSKNHKRKILFSNQHKTHGCSMTYFLDETGFYELVFRSRLPTAKMFREWVFTKVLPSIRKYGYYRMIDSKRKQRVIFDGKKFYKHPVFYNYAANKNGDVLSLKSKRIIKMANNRNGYLFFTICHKKLEKSLNYKQHRFVYEVFRGPIPRCLQTDHINGVKTDNRIKNLQLLTPQKNSEKSSGKPIISTNIETGKERRFNSIQAAAIELDIISSHISSICRKKRKTAKSKKDGRKYTFKFID